MGDMLVSFLLDVPARWPSVTVRLEDAAAIGRVRIPAAVANALSQAAGEAVRNALRHSGTREPIEVSAGSSRGGVWVSVSDRGHGLGPSFMPGFGIAESIDARMREVGGTATVSSQPGGGTAVRLTWTRPPERPTDLTSIHATTILSTDGRPLTDRVVYPALIGQLYLAFRHDGEAGHPMILAPLALSLAVATVLSIRSVARRAPTSTALFAWSLTMTGAVILGLYLAGPGSTTTFASWPIGFAALPLIVFSFVIPLRWLALTTVPPLLAVAGWVIFDDSSSWLDSLGAFSAAGVPSLLAWAVGAGVRRSVLALRREQDRLVATTAESQHLGSLARARARYLDHAKREIVPFLEAIADGDLALNESTRQQARIFGMEARDDLYVPGFYSAGLRSVVSDFRRRGGQVSLRPGLPPGAGARRCGRLMAELLTGLGPQSRLTLAPVGDSLGRIRLAVVPALADDHVGRLRARLSEDPEADAEISGDAFVSVLHFRDLPGTRDAQSYLNCDKQER